MTLDACRMLQNVTSSPADYTSRELQSCKRIQSELARLQDRLTGKGLFRRFLEDKIAAESGAEMACSSPSFLSAASGLIRSFSPKCLQTQLHPFC